MRKLIALAAALAVAAAMVVVALLPVTADVSLQGTTACASANPQPLLTPVASAVFCSQPNGSGSGGSGTGGSAGSGGFGSGSTQSSNGWGTTAGGGQTSLAGSAGSGSTGSGSTGAGPDESIRSNLGVEFQRCKDRRRKIGEVEGHWPVRWSR